MSMGLLFPSIITEVISVVPFSKKRCARLPSRPDRYVALFGEDQFDPSKRREAVSFEEQLRALEEVVKEGKVSAWVISNRLCN